jgi:hypothetical protein
MRTLLAIHSYPGANDLMKTLWPYYQKSGWDILGIGTNDGKTQWPDGVEFVNIGRNAYINDRSNLPQRLVNTIKHFLSTCVEYTHLCIVEYDCIFLAPLELNKTGITTHLAGYNVGTEANAFYHVPWIMDRETAAKIVEEGDRLLAARIYELGSPDLFIGLVLQNLGITPHESGTFSVNSFDTPNNILLGRDAIKNGCKFLHGIKSTQQLESILS